jgi:hypothetical protein
VWSSLSIAAQNWAGSERVQCPGHLLKQSLMMSIQLQGVSRSAGNSSLLGWDHCTTLHSPTYDLTWCAIWVVSSRLWLC